MSNLKSELLYFFPACSAASLLPPLPPPCPISKQAAIPTNPSCRPSALPAEVTLEPTIKKRDLITQDLLACKSETLATEQLPPHF